MRDGLLDVKVKFQALILGNSSLWDHVLIALVITHSIEGLSPGFFPIIGSLINFVNFYLGVLQRSIGCLTGGIHVVLDHVHLHDVDINTCVALPLIFWIVDSTLVVLRPQTDILFGLSTLKHIVELEFISLVVQRLLFQVLILRKFAEWVLCIPVAAMSVLLDQGILVVVPIVEHVSELQHVRLVISQEHRDIIIVDRKEFEDFLGPVHFVFGDLIEEVL